MRVPVLLLGHYSAVALWAAVIALLGLDAAVGSPALSTVLETVLVVSLLVWQVAYVCDSRYHQEQLCERCATASPLGDPQTAASRWRLVLRAYHSRAMALTVQAAVPAGAVLLLAFRAAGIRTEGTPLGYAASTAILVVLGAAALAVWQHRRLCPWCPFCYWDDDGEHEVSPDVPAPAASL
jgi:hypothetical protein